MPPLVKTIALPGGPRLEYVEQGDPSGLPMVLLHGVTDSWRSFEQVLPHLPSSIRALAISQRGHGDSDRPTEGYRTRNFAADLAGFIEALGLGAAIIVGHSMGATNAARFAIDYPRQTLGLVLAGSFASYRNNPAVSDFWHSSVAPLTDPIDPGFVRDFQEGTLAQPVASGLIDTAVAESLKVPARVWRDTFEGFFEDHVVGELGRIQAPTLILWGARDSLCRRSDQDELLAAIFGSRLIEYSAAGHALHWEEPERFAADIARFSEGVAVGGVTPASTSVSAMVPAPRAAVYRAFLDPTVLASWLPPAGMSGQVLAFEPRAGGAFSMSLVYGDAMDAPRGKSDANTDTFRGRFVELVPDERIVWAVEFDSSDVQFVGEMTIAWTMQDHEESTLVTVHCENIPPGIRPEDNEAGSHMSLANLAAHFGRKR